MNDAGIRERTGAMGDVTWATPQGTFTWMPGGGLYLIFGRSRVRVEHPAASSSYDTLKQARAALNDFHQASVATRGDEEPRSGGDSL